MGVWLVSGSVVAAVLIAAMRGRLTTTVALLLAVGISAVTVAAGIGAHRGGRPACSPESESE